VKIRLDRAVSRLGLASRSEARRLISDGLVTVRGRTVRDPGCLVPPERAAIAVAGREAPLQRWRTIAFHKPRGIVTTRRDPEGRPTVFDVLGEEAVGLLAVGRLDLASTGLLLLTTDRQLANALTDPRHRVVRRYVATVRGEVADAEAARLVSGIGDLRAASVTVRKRSRRETHLIVALTEGRNREIRRLFAAIGHEVTRLLRVAYGPVELGRLQPGQWREVSRDEMADVVAADAEEVATRSEARGSDRLPSRGAPESDRQYRRRPRAEGRRRPA
jgi:23S rRNA pseudouridine2605 synthase